MLGALAACKARVIERACVLIRFSSTSWLLSHPPSPKRRAEGVRSGVEQSGAGGPISGWGGRQGLPGDGVGRGIITFVGFVSGSSGAPSRLFAYLQRRSLEDWAPYASVASYVLPRCL